MEKERNKLPIKLDEYSLGAALDPILPKNAHRHFREFFRNVRDSRRFSWIGITRFKDELDRTNVAVYVLEEPIHDYTQAVDIVPSFDALADKLERRILINLYYINRVDCSPQKAQNLMETHCAKHERQLIWTHLFQ